MGARATSMNAAGEDVVEGDDPLGLELPKVREGRLFPKSAKGKLARRGGKVAREALFQRPASGDGLLNIYQFLSRDSSPAECSTTRARPYLGKLPSEGWLAAHMRAFGAALSRNAHEPSQHGPFRFRRVLLAALAAARAVGAPVPSGRSAAGSSCNHGSQLPRRAPRSHYAAP